MYDMRVDHSTPSPVQRRQYTNDIRYHSESYRDKKQLFFKPRPQQKQVRVNFHIHTFSLICSVASSATTFQQHRISLVLATEPYTLTFMAAQYFNVQLEKCCCQSSRAGETHSSHTLRNYIRSKLDTMYTIHQLSTNLYQYISLPAARISKHDLPFSNIT
jgi:hypothetical protein